MKRHGRCKHCGRRIGLDYLGICNLCRVNRRFPLVELAEERALSDAS